MGDSFEELLDPEFLPRIEHDYGWIRLLPGSNNECPHCKGTGIAGKGAGQDGKGAGNDHEAKGAGKADYEAKGAGKGSSSSSKCGKGTGDPLDEFIQSELADWKRRDGVLEEELFGDRSSPSKSEPRGQKRKTKFSGFEIKVRTDDDKQFRIMVAGNHTIEAVKNAIFKSHGIPIEEQSLIVAGTLLEEGNLTLKDYKVNSRHVIQLSRSSVHGP
jgi:hypothetical protein